MAEKTRLIEETLEPGISVSFVARKHGLSPSLLPKWRQRIAEDGREAVRVDHEMIGAAASSGRHAVALCAVGRGRKSKILSCLQALGGRVSGLAHTGSSPSEDLTFSGNLTGNG